MDDQVYTSFVRIFGEQPTLLVRLPGRVNLTSEQTDYNEGWVFPATINLGTLVAARRRFNHVLHTVALRFNAEDQTHIDNLRPREGSVWTRYVRGVVELLEAEGCTLSGADLLIDSDLPLGGGLSSSASLELDVALALTTLAGYTVDPKTKVHGLGGGI